MLKKLFNKFNSYLTTIQDCYLNYCLSEEEKWNFIWGIKSSDDLNEGSEATLYTLNDFDICYNKENKKYIISLETFYEFEKGIKDQQNYLLNILSCFTDWMKQNNLNTNLIIPLDCIFTMGSGNFYEFDTIEELYAYFKLLVNGFCAQEEIE